MSREYRHMEEYEKEIIRLWEEGRTLLEISERLGFTYKQVREFKTRYNRKQRKIAVGIAIKKKGRPTKDSVVTKEDKVADLRYKLARKDAIYRAKIRTYEEARLLIGAYIHIYNNERIQLKTKLTPVHCLIFNSFCHQGCFCTVCIIWGCSENGSLFDYHQIPC